MGWDGLCGDGEDIEMKRGRMSMGKWVVPVEWTEEYLWEFLCEAETKEEAVGKVKKAVGEMDLRDEEHRKGEGKVFIFDSGVEEFDGDEEEFDELL